MPGFTWQQAAAASDLILPTNPDPPQVEAVRSVDSSLTWGGIIIGRIWPPDFTEADYLALLLGSTARAREYKRGMLVKRSPDEARAINRRLDRECLDGFESHNTVCNAGRTVILNWLGLVAGQTGINYFAVGNGAGTVSSTDTTLFSEQFRKGVTSSAVTGNQVDVSTFFNSSEGNLTYTEAGIFGNGATATVNSGALFGHAPYAYTKNSSIALTNDYFITLN